ncbi:MAG: SulP family inorganic anion transporter [Maribacter dokdonensis]|uniref:Sulfate permease, SulP family n=3 Tax=Maribacter TaxID=252356 RepID=A0A1H4KGF1_9FLAO|nr:MULTISPECIES: SulP family inorganic anion transporter [Maribacter]KSA13076.1 Sulfate permease [Maribacter dokdonensis DSW-8]CAG2535133.1 SulP family [Maribacter dokdonensis]SDT39396.1 sulfate permease, SulP family [Maribacter dokdonensis]SEB57634.1 sulfate permease, SulP family [Maribacter dokdonensis]|tara:strand:- start:169002 stop:170633 length:1632 start_codon:yes stop_codon:yes gene_type:complete
MQKYLNIFDFKQKVDYKNEILAGLTVAMTMIPESLMFAILAGFSPLVGLYGAFIMGLVTSIFGGRPGLISGGAGATVVVLMALMNSHGLEYVFGAVALAGVIQMIIGFLKLGKFIRLVPQPVMFGFVNGLAIIIFMAQMDQFKVGVGDAAVWLTGPAMYTMLGLVLFTIAIIVFVPKLTKAVPASLIGIIVVFLIVYFFNIDTKQVVDIINQDTLPGEELKSLSGTLPTFHIPQIPFTFEDFKIILPYGLIMAAVGLTEGLLTLNLVDEITGTKGNSNRECVAQGGANILNGFFGGMGGCPMIAQTLVNLSAGSRARLSGIIASLTILLIILFGAPVIELVPIAALVGVMVMVSVGTFEWASFKALRRMPKSDIFVMILVTLITVFLHNLALAVLIGVIISALVFAWESAKRIRARKHIDENGVKHYEIYGPLFFGSTTLFNEKFDVQGDPDHIIIDFKESRVSDMSGIEALNKITERYAQVGKKVLLRHLSKDCIRLLANADDIIDVNVMEDPTYKVMVDKPLAKKKDKDPETQNPFKLWGL